MSEVHNLPVADLYNQSGIIPVEYKVLVQIKSDDLNEKGERVLGSGIIIPSQTTEREEMAKVEGVLIDVGGNAFEDWSGLKPEPGTKVLISKYAGMTCKGQDDQEYRLCSDKDIAAILR